MRHHVSGLRVMLVNGGNDGQKVTLKTALARLSNKELVDIF